MAESVAKSEYIGLDVCAVTTDMGSNNLQMSNLFNVSPEKNDIYINDDRIFYIFDIPHVIKALRNMVMKYDFYVDGKIISWQYIKTFYDHNKNYPVKAAPKLCESHIRPTNFEKMKIKFVTQLFSATVSAG